VPDDPTNGVDDQDESFLRELRGIADQVDPVPPRLKEAAKASLLWRTVDAELAELTFDSLRDESAATLVRGDQGVRLLSFEAPGDPGLVISLEVLAERGRRRLLGQLDPPQSAEVEIRQPSGARSLEADRRGRFAVELSPGPVSLRCRTGGTAPGATVITDWVSI
jgi:hypothetical protein